MEKIEITLRNSNGVKQIGLFEKHLHRQGISDLQKVEICREKSIDGQMGLGKIKNSLNAFVETVKVLPELLKSSVSFSLKFRTDISLRISNLELRMQHSNLPTTDEQIKQLSEKMDLLLQQKSNSIIIYGDKNVILQDVNANNVNVKKT